jgi:hypothetical protein
MPSLLSDIAGITPLSGTEGLDSIFTSLANTQPLLGPTPTQDTGYTLVGTNGVLSFTSTLGQVYFNNGSIQAQNFNQNLIIQSTGTGTINLIGTVLLNGSLIATNSGTFNTIVDIFDNTNSTSTTTGALLVRGGAGIGRDVNIGGSGTFSSGNSGQVQIGNDSNGQIEIGQQGRTTSGTPYIDFHSAVNSDDYDARIQVTGGTGTNIGQATLSLIAAKVTLPNTTNSTSTTTGALTLAGGVGVGKDLYVGGNIYGSSGIFTAAEGRVSSTATSQSTNTGALQVVGGLGIGADAYIGQNLTVFKDLTVGENADLNGLNSRISIQPTGANGIVIISSGDLGTIDHMSIGQTTAAAAKFTNLTATTLTITSSASSTSTTTGAVQIAGGVGIQGSVYSAEGKPQENYLLYSPRVTLAPVPPESPRIGDFWYDLNSFSYQYIQDGTSTFWIQVGSTV